MHNNTISNNVSILLARLSAAGKEVVLYLVARNTLKKKKNLREGLATEDVVANPSPRTEDSVANHSRKFYDPPRNIFNLSNVSRRTANQKSTKIGEPRAQLPILLRVLRISKNVWPEMHQNLK